MGCRVCGLGRATLNPQAATVSVISPVIHPDRLLVSSPLLPPCFLRSVGAISKVYAVEYTEMAKHARTLVEKNGFKDVIEVIQGSAESVQLPEKVRYLTLPI